jgi:hypothetical protein
MRTARFLLSLLAVAASVPAQSSRRAVIVDVDGVRGDTFKAILESGTTPNLSRIFGSALWFDRATTVIPTVTMAAQASIVTGTPPERHGIPGNQWYDRDHERLVDYMTSAGLSCVYGFTILAGSGCIGGLANRHLETPTLYEAAAARGFDSVVAYSQYWKGATRPAPPTAAEAKAFIQGNKLAFRIFDTEMTDRVVKELNSRGLPAILTIYFTGADTIAHTDGIGAQAGYFAEVIDPAVGRILDAMETLDPAWRARTMFVLVSDHGRTDSVAHPEDVDLLAKLKAALPPGAHVAHNTGTAYIYLDQPLPTLADSLEREFAETVASVRARTASDPARSGDLIVTLRPGHYFGNDGAGSHHGGVAAEDLSVPLLVAAPGIAAGHTTVSVNVTAIARTVPDYLGFPMEEAAPALPIRWQASGK